MNWCPSLRGANSDQSHLGQYDASNSLQLYQLKLMVNSVSWLGREETNLVQSKGRPSPFTCCPPRGSVPADLGNRCAVPRLLKREGHLLLVTFDFLTDLAV